MLWAVGELAAALLAERHPDALAGVGAPRRQRLLAVDATAVVPPGDKRAYWLVHTVFDLTALRVRAVAVTDRSQAECLARGAPQLGELRIADRGHAKVEDLAQVVQSGADFLVRLPASHPRLLDAEGRVLDRLALCREAGRNGSLDRVVMARSAKVRGRGESPSRHPALARRRRRQGPPRRATPGTGATTPATRAWRWRATSCS